MSDKLQAVLRKLDGKKSYLGAIGYGVLGILWSEHYVSDDTAKLIGLLITAWTGFAIRSAITKSGGNSGPTLNVHGGTVNLPGPSAEFRITDVNTTAEKLAKEGERDGS